MDSGESENSDDYRARFSAPCPTQAGSARSLMVQPILISSSATPTPPTTTGRARAPPSLIPISSFANQFKAHTQQIFETNPGVQNFRLPSSFHQHPTAEVGIAEEEADDVEDDEDVEDDSWVGTPAPAQTPSKQSNTRQDVLQAGQRKTQYPVSTSPLVSTSSHSVVSGVKLHIHRAPVSQAVTISEDTERLGQGEPDLYSDESEECKTAQEETSSLNASSNLNSILNAIRNNTSLTIEEVPAKPSTSGSSGSSRYANSESGSTSRGEEFMRGGTNDKVEVFIVPQPTPVKAPNKNEFQVFSNVSQTLSAPASAVRGKRGRPRRVNTSTREMSTPGPETVTEDTPESSGSRRTPRDRKPTKHFMPDFSRFRGYKKRGIDLEASKPDEVSTPSPVREATSEHGSMEQTSEFATPVKRRGRPSTGRARGRPRGSTRKPKPESETPTSGEGQDAEKPNPQSETTSHGTDAGDDASSLRKSVKTPRGMRAARGGGRGGKRITKAQKIQKAKLKKLLSNRKDSLQLFEEETRMSSDVKPALAIMQIAEVGEDASNSTSTTSTTKQKKQSKVTEIEEQRPVTADTLFEYHWPADDPLAEIFFLQEQVSEYLGVKSFKRKYPDLKRRTVEMAERDFLRGHKIVSEMQCDLGLTALYSNNVLEIMFNDFPDKYEEYRIVVQERRDREFMKQKSQQPTTAATVRDKGAEFMRRILNSAASWNSQLNRERNEERSCCFDQQTFTMNIQRSKMKILPPHATKIGYYPVSVLPGQYTDTFTKYSADELKYLPLNTVSFGPVIDNQFNGAGSEDSSDSDGSSSSSDDTSSSSDSDDKDGSDREKRSFNLGTNSFGNITSIVGENGAVGKSLSCKTCEGGTTKNKDGQFEVLIQCTKCDVANHPSCLELSLDMLPFIRKYNWQCTDCKNCIECNDPADEDKMLFCDLCDRGYHIYCVGLRKVPTGRWHCRVCSICHSCGTTKSTTDDRGTEWHHEFKKDKGAKVYSHSICTACHKLFKKGQFCPTCNKSHPKIDEKVLLECRGCEKWVHKECTKRTLQPMFGAMCEPCDSAQRAKSKIPSKDSFVKQNFYFY